MGRARLYRSAERGGEGNEGADHLRRAGRDGYSVLERAALGFYGSEGDRRDRRGCDRAAGECGGDCDFETVIPRALSLGRGWREAPGEGPWSELLKFEVRGSKFE